MANSGISFRGKIRIFGYICFALAAITVFSVVQTVKVKKYEREILLSRQRALISLDEYLDDINTDLRKIVIVNTPSMISSLSTELWRDCAEAKNSLAELPSSESSVANTYTFLSQVGEYIMSIQRKSMNGEKLTEEERQRLSELSVYSTELAEKLGNMCYGLENGTFSFEKNSNMFLKSDMANDTIFDKMDDVEQTLSDIPTLTFDGPFSSHLENENPQLLKNKNEISKKDAEKVAKKVSGCDDLSFAFDENGNIPCYVFKSNEQTIAITKKGGYPLYMICDGFAGEITVKNDDAVKIAKKYLKKIGYENMTESYYFTDDGICTVNFAYSQNGIICYSDLIKVSVNLQNGKIHSFDATGYISCHTKRSIPENAKTVNECKKSLYGGLNIETACACFIPTEWKSEIYCYEYLCTSKDGQHLLVYVNALTGEEENILILIYGDGGVLTR